jgi:cobalt-zinc-cadmium efflux system outer membrane protein
LRQQREVSLANESLRLVEDLRSRVRLQVEVGEAARLEQTRADAEVASAQTFARSAQLRLLNALATLRTVVSAPLPSAIHPTGSLELVRPLPSLEELRSEIISNHPAIAQARAEVQQSEARLKQEIALRKPAPTVFGEYERQPDLGFYRFGVSLPVPVWNRREGPIGEAESAVKQARATEDLRRIELTAALERAYGQYQVATQQVELFQQGVLQQAEAAVNAAEAAFRFGERGIIEVLDAQRVLRSVRLDYLNAQFDLQSALIDVDQLRSVDIGRQP